MKSVFEKMAENPRFTAWRNKPTPVGFNTRKQVDISSEFEQERKDRLARDYAESKQISAALKKACGEVKLSRADYVSAKELGVILGVNTRHALLLLKKSGIPHDISTSDFDKAESGRKVRAGRYWLKSKLDGLINNFVRYATQKAQKGVKK